MWPFRITNIPRTNVIAMLVMKSETGDWREREIRRVVYETYFKLQYNFRLFFFFF